MQLDKASSLEEIPAAVRTLNRWLGALAAALRAEAAVAKAMVVVLMVATGMLVQHDEQQHPEMLRIDERGGPQRARTS